MNEQNESKWQQNLKDLRLRLETYLTRSGCLIPADLEYEFAQIAQSIKEPVRIWYSTTKEGATEKHPFKEPAIDQSIFTRHGNERIYEIDGEYYFYHFEPHLDKLDQIYWTPRYEDSPPTQAERRITAGEVDWENDSTITLKGHYWCKQEKCNVIWSGESFVYEDKSEHVSSDYFDYYGPLEKI